MQLNASSWTVVVYVIWHLLQKLKIMLVKKKVAK